MMAPKLRVRALGAELASRLEAEPRLPRPHSVFTRAVNFETVDGTLFAVHGPGPLAAPFAIALERWRDDVADGGLTLDLGRARRVDLRVRPAWEFAEHARRLLRDGLLATRGARGARGLDSPGARAARAALSGAIRRRDAADFLDAARELVGLGEGLTPAGDDYLVGTLAVLHRLAGGWPGAASVARALGAHAGDATTTVGAAFLRHAVAGQFSEPLRDLAMAESAAAAHVAAATLAGMGATSGADTLVGVRAALDALARADVRV